jgi:FkbM family methyltransferase
LIKFLYTYFPKQYGFVLGVVAQALKPFKLFFFKMGCNIFFGNKEQDKWVIKDIFRSKRNGYFVDLAATDGIHENNTFVLEKKLGWKGICIEPNSLFYKKLKKNRKCHCINKVVSDKKKEIKFFENGGVGGIIGSNYDNNFQKRSKIINKISNVRKIKIYNAVTLFSILKKYKAPKVIDYLSLDVEGAEADVLRKFPFKIYKFLTLSIERPPPLVNKLLFKNDYIFVKNHKVDTFYIHKTLQKKIKIKVDKFEQIGKKQW